MAIAKKHILPIGYTSCQCTCAVVCTVKRLIGVDHMGLAVWLGHELVQCLHSKRRIGGRGGGSLCQPATNTSDSLHQYMRVYVCICICMCVDVCVYFVLILPKFVLYFAFYCIRLGGAGTVGVLPRIAQLSILHGYGIQAYVPWHIVYTVALDDIRHMYSKIAWIISDFIATAFMLSSRSLHLYRSSHL